MLEFWMKDRKKGRKGRVIIVMSWKCKKNPSLQSKSFYNLEY